MRLTHSEDHEPGSWRGPCYTLQVVLHCSHKPRDVSPVIKLTVDAGVTIGHRLSCTLGTVPSARVSLAAVSRKIIAINIINIACICARTRYRFRSYMDRLSDVVHATIKVWMVHSIIEG